MKVLLEYLICLKMKSIQYLSLLMKQLNGNIRMRNMLHQQKKVR